MPPQYDPNETSIANSLAGSEYGFTNAPVIEDPASFAIEPTGEQMDLQFLNDLALAGGTLAATVADSPTVAGA